MLFGQYFGIIFIFVLQYVSRSKRIAMGLFVGLTMV